MTNDDGYAICLEAKTGNRVWRERLKGKHSASPIYGAGRIYFFSEKGVGTVLRPGDKLVILGGPAMLIGLGGGAASSMASGTGGSTATHSCSRTGNEARHVPLPVARKGQRWSSVCDRRASDSRPGTGSVRRRVDLASVAGAF